MEGVLIKRVETSRRWREGGQGSVYEEGFSYGRMVC
jgi:hypothetical protein